MKKILNLQVCFALFLSAVPLAAKAQTFFFDNFTTGSTVNQPVNTNAITGTSTSYQTYQGLAGGTSSVAPHDLNVTLDNSAAVLGELVCLFTNQPIALTTNGDYIAVSVVFVDSNILCGLDASTASLNIGLFNSGGVPPNQGEIITSTGTTSGGTQTWLGYFGRLYINGASSIITRPSQTVSTSTSQNQDLLFTGASGTQSFNNPKGATVGSTVTTSESVSSGLTYTLQLVINYVGSGSVSISNALFAGSGTSGTPLGAVPNQIATNATFLTGAFDGLAIGWRNGATAQLSLMDIASIQITGQSTGPSGPPIITSQPVSAAVATNGSCAFFVSATGTSVGYHWYRNGTNLVDGGNISGSQSSTLVISPAGPADVFSTNNGYYVAVSGSGGYTTNSATNFLALRAATNLIWNPTSGTSWDVNSNANWQDPFNNQIVFNYGDSVTFNDLAGGGGVTLTGPYLSAASVTVSATSSSPYTFAAASSGGSFAGPGSFIYNGSVRLNINNANTYSGGTIISNAGANLYLGNLNGLGTGPVTLAGGKMEIIPAGSGSAWISSDIIVANDFSIQLDGTGSYAGFFTGNLSGTTNKTLTFTVPAANTTTNERIRFSAANITYNANLQLSNSLLTLAPYNASGVQTYNGVISGAGGLIERGSGVMILNGANTYSGGTTPTTGAIGLGCDTVWTSSVTNGPIGSGPLILAPEVPNITASGAVFASGGARTIANPIQYPSATNNLTLIIGGTNDLTFTGPFTLYGNDGLGTNNIRLLQVTNSAVTTFSGVISDSTNGVSEVFGLSVNGNGTNAVGPLVLSAIETYTGPTTITNCTLQVNGQLAAGSAVTVNSNATLSGIGTIYGRVAINVGGALAPGTASIGTLNINNNLTLAGNVKVRVSHPATSDEAVVSGGITNTGTGTVTVTTLGTAPQVNDTFQLFSHAVTNGNLLTVTGAGLNWTNKLAIDGTIMALSAVSTVATNSTNIVFYVTNGTGGGTSLVLSWPTDHTGWTLQAQTNSLGVGLSNNWSVVAGSTGTNTVVMPFDNTKGAVFYRLKYP